MIYFLTEIRLTPGGSSTVHIYTQPIHRTTQLTQTEENARKNLNQGSRRMPVGTMKTEYTEQSIHNNKNT